MGDRPTRGTRSAMGTAASQSLIEDIWKREDPVWTEILACANRFHRGVGVSVEAPPRPHVGNGNEGAAKMRGGGRANAGSSPSCRTCSSLAADSGKDLRAKVVARLGYAALVVQACRIAIGALTVKGEHGVGAGHWYIRHRLSWTVIRIFVKDLRPSLFLLSLRYQNYHARYSS